MPRYELSDGSSNKFWDITLSGKSLTTNFGKIGASGQTQIKAFGSDAEAKQQYDKLIAEKTKKGYQLAGKAAKATKSAPAAAKSAKADKPAKGGKAAKSSGQYFEFVDGGSSKFWEVSLDGTAIKTRYGKIGSDGQETVKNHGNAGEARSEHDKLVAEKTKKGYKLVRGDVPAAATATHAHNAKLEAAIEADPDDPGAYVVYADWLQAQGDIRGELIVLQHANKTAPAKKLIEQNKEHFYGKAADLQDMLEAYPYEPLGKPTTWRWGYLESLWISMKKERSSMYGSATKDEVDPDEALEWLLDHPSTRFLRELTVGILSYEGNGYDNTVKVIGKKPRATIRKLTLGDFYSEETELNWSDIGNCNPLYKGVPNLESLTLRSGSMKLGKIDLPKLMELTIITGGLDRGSLAAICDAKWPRLERLSLQLGNETKFKLKDLEPIMDGKAFPKVRHLGLANADGTDQICEWLAASKIASQLESLDLSKGTMGEAGANVLGAARNRFKKLTQLDVSENWINKAGLAALAVYGDALAAKPSGKRKRREGQQDDGGDPEDRYISAYE